MKITSLLKTLTIFTIFSLSVTSCQNELDEPQWQMPLEDAPLLDLFLIPVQKSLLLGMENA